MDWRARWAAIHGWQRVGYDWVHTHAGKVEMFFLQFLFDLLMLSHFVRFALEIQHTGGLLIDDTQGNDESCRWSKVAQSFLTLCDPMDYSLPCSSVHGIFQARVLEWVAIFFFRGFSQSRDWTWVSRIVGRCFTIWATREVCRQSMHVQFIYRCPRPETLNNPQLFSAALSATSRGKCLLCCLSVNRHPWIFTIIIQH